MLASQQHECKIRHKQSCLGKPVAAHCWAIATESGRRKHRSSIYLADIWSHEYKLSQGALQEQKIRVWKPEQML